jgi:serine/threonine protein phosphatase PrpC
LAAVRRAKFGSKSVQNNRTHMEDRELAINLTGHSAFGFAKSAVLCAVFDGHGGDETAQYLATHMVEHIVSQGAAALQKEPDSALARAIGCAEHEVQSTWVPGAGHASGSTLCLCLLVDDKLHIAHVGDSRAVLAKGGKAVPLTADHKPSSPAEAERIRAADPGATITADGYLYGELGVSRGLGSAHLKADPSKRAYVATAEITSVQLGSGDDFVVLATDGLWDQVGPQDAVATARRSLAEHNDAAAAAEALVERAQKLGADDNISVVVLLLHGRGIVLPKSNSRLFARRPVAAAAGPAVHGEGACVSEAAAAADN